MRVADLVPKLLQVGILSCLEMLVKFWLVIAILDPEINDLSGDPCVGEVKGRSGIELDVLSRDVFYFIKEVAVNIKDFRCEASGLRNTILFLISTAKRGRKRNSSLHQVLGRLVRCCTGTTQAILSLQQTCFALDAWAGSSRR